MRIEVGLRVLSRLRRGSTRDGRGASRSSSPASMSIKLARSATSRQRVPRILLLGYRYEAQMRSRQRLGCPLLECGVPPYATDPRCFHDRARYRIDGPHHTGPWTRGVDLGAVRLPLPLVEHVQNLHSGASEWRDDIIARLIGMPTDPEGPVTSSRRDRSWPGILLCCLESLYYWRHMKRSLGSILIAAASITGGGCNSSSEPRLTGPASISVEAPAPASVTVGTPVAPLPVFVVLDSSNRGLPNVTVAFTATGGSQVTPLTAVTDKKGRVSPNSWVMPAHVGSAFLIATIPATGLTVSTSTASVAGPPAKVIITANPPSISLTETATLSSVVTDAQQNPLPLASVTYSSSNSAVASISGDKIIPHATGDVVITGVVTGTTVSGTLGFSVLERVSNLSGRPFGIAYLGGQSPELLVTELDVNSLAVLNASTYAPLSTVPTSATPTDIAINSSGTIAYVTGVDGPSITVVTLPAGTSQQTIAEAGAARLLLSPDGSRLYVGKTGGFDVLSTSTGARIAGFSTGGQINGMAMSADGSTLWLSNDFTGKVYRVNASTATITDSAAVGGAPQEVVYHAASGTVYVANESGWIDALEGTHLGTVRRIGNISGAFGMRLTADGNKLVVASTFSGLLYILDRANAVVTKTVTVGGSPRRIALLPDGRVAIASEAGYVTLLTP